MNNTTTPDPETADTIPCPPCWHDDPIGWLPTTLVESATEADLEFEVEA